MGDVPEVILLLALPVLLSAGMAGAIYIVARSANLEEGRLRGWGDILVAQQPLSPHPCAPSASPRPLPPSESWRTDFGALLAACGSPGLPLNFLILAALAAARGGSPGPSALALCMFAFFAHHALGCPLPRRAYRDLVRYTALRLHTEKERTGLAPPLLQEFLEVDPKFPVFTDLLERLWAEQRFGEIVETSRAFRKLTRVGERALGADPAAFRLRSRPPIQYAEALTAAELIGRGLIGIDHFDRKTVEKWALPLMKKSTERYLPKAIIGHFLCEHLDRCAEPERLVRAIEAEIPPRAWDDYSNFREVFSMRSWKTLRRFLTKPQIVTELDSFVTKNNRREFWHEFNGRSDHEGRRIVGEAAAFAQRV